MPSFPPSYAADHRSFEPASLLLGQFRGRNVPRPVRPRLAATPMAGPYGLVRGADQSLGNSLAGNFLTARVGGPPGALMPHMWPARDGHLPQRPLRLGLLGGWIWQTTRTSSDPLRIDRRQSHPAADVQCRRQMQPPARPLPKGSSAARDGGPQGALRLHSRHCLYAIPERKVSVCISNINITCVRTHKTYIRQTKCPSRVGEAKTEMCRRRRTR